MAMHKGPNAKLSQRIAEEAQLLSEEKWMIDALKKLKELRNCLQIERLHLENLKSNLRSGGDKKSKSSSTVTTKALGEVSQVSTSHSNSKVQPHSVEFQASNARSSGSSLQNFEAPVAGIDDEMCNMEELNLSVTNSVFANQDPGFDMEEDEEDMENCVIDMNMFMYGK